MTRNVGGADRVIRVIVGVALLFLFLLEGPWHWLGLLAVVPLGTAALGYCPLWTVCKVNTAAKS